MAATCRYYGNSRNVFYRWKCRYEDEGLEGLKDRSSAPLYCPHGHSSRRGREDHPPAPALSLRAHEDQDVPEALPRRRDQRVWGVANPQGLRMNRLPASQRKRHTDRGSPTRSSVPANTCNRRQVHRAHHHRIRPPQALLPVHRDRRLHPTARPTGLSPLRPKDCDPVPRLCRVTTALPCRKDPD